MYIIYESVAGNDPRVTEEFKIIDQFWHYTIAYIAPEDESEVFTKWLKPVEVTEAVAKSYKFADAHEGELSLRRPVDANGDGYIDEIEAASDQTEKYIHTVSASEEANCVALLKAIMTNYLQNHNEGDTDLVTNLQAKIDAVSTLTEAQMLMATYYDFDCLSTAGKDKTKEFDVPWDDT